PSGNRPVPSTLLLQERQNLLRTGIGLGQHRDTRLLQYLGLGHFRGLSCEVGVQDTALGSTHILDRGAQVCNGGLKAVLDRTELTTQTVHCFQSRVNVNNHFICFVHGGHISFTETSRDAGSSSTATQRIGSSGKSNRTNVLGRLNLNLVTVFVQNRRRTFQLTVDLVQDLVNRIFITSKGNDLLISADTQSHIRTVSDGIGGPVRTSEININFL